MSRSETDYHLAELAVARASDDPRRIVPEIPEGCRRLLDVGCGAGQTLIACNLKNARAFAVDFDREALRIAREMQAPAELACSRGEVLPFASGSFDFLYSRVALPYMNIPAAVREFWRVLAPGGGLWLTLHPLSMLDLTRAMTSPKRALFEVYRLANTAALHWLGRQFAYPLKRSRTESYQTSAGIRKALTQSGFNTVEISRTATHFIVRAQKLRNEPTAERH